MRILNIAIKEIKQSLRDKKNMIIMTLFPIVLIVILGAAFSSVMGKSIDLGKIEVLYTLKSEGTISDSFESLQKDLNSYNVAFTKIEDVESGKNSIQNSKYACYIIIDDNTKEIILYKNERYNFNASFVEGIIDTFKQRYNVITEIAAVNPQIIPQVLKEDNTKYVKLESLDDKKQPRAIDYYGVTMTSLFILYAAMTAAYGIKQEQTRKTGNRIKISPVTRGEVFSGKVMGFWIVSIIQIGIVFLFSKYAIKVDWGQNVGPIIAILLSEILLAVSIGAVVSLYIKSEGAMSGVLNLIIPLIAFLGGAYVPIEQFGGGVLATLTKLSPLTWINEAILNVIYRNDFNKVMPAIIVCLGATMILLIVSSFAYRREEV